MKLLKRVANHQRNAFDMSHRHLCVAKFGELLPITCLEVVPDDYVELSVADLLRAAPMVTSPFMRAKQHIDVYYVPYCDIWSQFEAFMTSKQEPKHASALGSAAVPHINLFNLQTSAVSSGSTDVVGQNYSSGAVRLLDLLGYGRQDLSGSSATHPAVNLWRLAAYNKIWYEHYRQQYYDSGLRFMSQSDFTVEQNPAVLFNFDDIVAQASGSADIWQNASSRIIASGSAGVRVKEMCQMRYRLWKKDLFTGLMPSTQFGNVSTIFSDINNDNAPGSIDYIVRSLNNISYIRDSADSSATSYHLTSSVDILSLRKSEALQIWREAALTAGNRIADNMRAHYGSEAEYAMHESQLIGSVSAPLNISDVNATAQVGSSVNQALGDVAGKGISSMDDKVFKFKAKKFGVIMVMFSLLPEAEYESYGIDRMNQLLEHEDYFVPEYMDLGLEAVSSLTFYNNPLSSSAVIGYAPRYIGYKQKLDKCFYGFRNGESFAPWASPKKDVSTALGSTPGTMPLSALYVNPSLFDGNFVSGASLSAQFICDFFFDCTKVSPMSVSSLPRI